MSELHLTFHFEYDEEVIFFPPCSDLTPVAPPVCQPTVLQEERRVPQRQLTGQNRRRACEKLVVPVCTLWMAINEDVVSEPADLLPTRGGEAAGKHTALRVLTGHMNIW